MCKSIRGLAPRTNIDSRFHLFVLYLVHMKLFFTVSQCIDICKGSRASVKLVNYRLLTECGEGNVLVCVSVHWEGTPSSGAWSSGGNP